MSQPVPPQQPSLQCNKAIDQLKIPIYAKPEGQTCQDFSAFLGLSPLALPQDYHPLDLDKPGKPLKFPSSFPPQSRLWNQKFVEEQRAKSRMSCSFRWVFTLLVLSIFCKALTNKVPPQGHSYWDEAVTTHVFCFERSFSPLFSPVTVSTNSCAPGPGGFFHRWMFIRFHGICVPDLCCDPMVPPAVEAGHALH